MRAIVLDESLTLAQRAQEVLALLNVQMTMARSPQELRTALAADGASDLLIVRLVGEFGAWDVAERLRQARFQGRTVVFAEELSDPGIGYLKQISRTECLPLPSSTGLLVKVLKRIVTETFFSPSRPSRHMPPPLPMFHGMVGRSERMLEVFSRIEKVAAGDANVCIYGESGTGKELIARAIHYSGARRNGPLITLDCAAVPEGLMESRLFGHVRGAFTGAVDHSEGVFGLAHTGTLFMDELCELSQSLQAKLLRVIQTREFLKVGGTKPMKIDIRLITATNKELKQEVDKGTFREDLYYRIAVVMIRVPPLRERKEDIPLLVEHFLRRFAAVYKKPISGLAPSVLDRMMALPWPGNIRQLEHVLEQAVVLAEGELLSEADLVLDPFPLPSACLTIPMSAEPVLPLREVERRHILHTLHTARGNRTRAAKLLGISTRCLQYKLKAYLQQDHGEIPQADSRAV